MKELFKGLKWWEITICAIPFILVFVGGAIGGAIGAGATVLNIKIWKKSSSTPLKVLQIAGVTIASFVVFGVAAAIFTSLIGGTN